MKNKLPTPSKAALAHSNQLLNQIVENIQENGPIPFSQFMAMALYAPELGYYQHSNPFAKEGDFITAAHCGPWFAKMLANQIKQIFTTTPLTVICEFAAGDGTMALALLSSLQQQKSLPSKYIIVEQSNHLIKKQQALFTKHPKLLDLIEWQSTLPQQFEGIIFANELLDALPFDQYRKNKQHYEQAFVTINNQQLALTWLPKKATLSQTVKEYENIIPNNYIFELSLQSEQWLKEIYQHSKQAICLLIDYGFVAQQYFSRGETGYARAFYKHHVHDDLLLWPGLQDITTHINFTDIAIAAVNNHWDILGFTNQANFLMSCGIEQLQLPEYDTAAGIQARAEIKTLLMPHEMGETFKLLALGKNIDLDLIGFEHDISYQL